MSFSFTEIFLFGLLIFFTVSQIRYQIRSVEWNLIPIKSYQSIKKYQDILLWSGTTTKKFQDCSTPGSESEMDVKFPLFTGMK